LASGFPMPWSPCSLLASIRPKTRCKAISGAPQEPLVRLGDRFFYSQYQAGAHFKTMLCSYEIGQVISDPDDTKDLVELLNVHPK